MMRIAAHITVIVLLSCAISAPILAHCEIPCGIYGDTLRVSWLALAEGSLDSASICFMDFSIVVICSATASNRPSSPYIPHGIWQCE